MSHIWIWTFSHGHMWCIFCCSNLLHQFPLWPPNTSKALQVLAYGKAAGERYHDSNDDCRLPMVTPEMTTVLNGYWIIIQYWIFNEYWMNGSQLLLLNEDWMNIWINVTTKFSTYSGYRWCKYFYTWPILGPLWPNPQDRSVVEPKDLKGASSIALQNIPQWSARVQCVFKNIPCNYIYIII